MTLRIRWTPEMDASLRELRGKGFSVLDCAPRIGVSHQLVRRRLIELGLPTGRMNRGCVSGVTVKAEQAAA